MTYFDENIWQPLIQAFENGNKEIFDEKFSRLYKSYSDYIQNIILKKYYCAKATAEDCAHESFVVLLSNINNKKDMRFESANELFRYLFIIANRMAIELIYRVPKRADIDDSVDITYIPKYLDQPSGNVFRDIYDGRNDIDGLLKKEYECFKLLELKIIKNFSYKKILTLEEYSNFTEVSLRQKVSRFLKKYKNFIKD